MQGYDGAQARGSRGIAFLVCPSESLIEGFVHRAHEMEPDLVRALSSHLARCGLCRDEADRRRRGMEASVALRPWIWALAAVVLLGAAAAIFLDRELAGIFPPGVPHAAARPQPRLAALARFDPPDNALIASIEGESAAGTPAMSAEDRREFAAARASLVGERAGDAARLLEDLAGRHPERLGLNLVLAFAQARAGESEKARRSYALAEAQGAGRPACWGLANVSLRLGDVAFARHELASHILARDPDDEAARSLLDRLDTLSARVPR